MNEESNHHPSGALFSDFVTGRLANDELDEFARHLASCGECAKRLELALAQDSCVIGLRRHLANDTIEHCGEMPNSSSRVAPSNNDDATPKLSGNTLGEYELYEPPIARGGMGVIYKAQHRDLGRVDAIKRIHSVRRADPAFVDRFFIEAKAVAKLSHKNIVAIHGIARDDDGDPYFIMEFVAGKNLAEVCNGTPLPVGKAVAYVRDIASAVGYVHDEGIVHRDLKPENVLVSDENNAVRITDFGLAKLIDDDSGLTSVGRIIGTPAYMPPEQAAGEPGRDEKAGDIYSTGAILYYLLTGRPPFLGMPEIVLHRVQEEDPVRPRKLNGRVPRDLETICLKAMAKSAASRYSTADELAKDLDRFANREPILGRRDRLVSKMRRRFRRAPLPWSFACVAMITAIVISGWMIWSAARFRRLERFQERIEAKLESNLLDPERFDVVETEIAVLESIAPRKGEQLRKRLHTTYATLVENKIEQLRLTDSDCDEIEDRIEFIELRSANIADSLRQKLTKRLKAWEPVFDVAFPFDNLGVLDDEEIEIVADRLVRSSQTTVLCRAKCNGRVRLTVDFDATWEDSYELGVMLNVTDQSHYKCVLRSRSSMESKKTRSFQSARNNRSSFFVEVHRGKAVLRSWQIPAKAIAEGPLRFRSQRIGGRLTISINDIESYEFEDLFPLASDEAGVFGIIWPASVGVTKVTAEQQMLNIGASPLDYADEFYAFELYDRALRNYDQLLGEDQDNQELKFKKAMCLTRLERTEEATQLLSEIAVEAGTPWPMHANCQLWLLYLRDENLEKANAAFKTLREKYDSGTIARFLQEKDRRMVFYIYRSPESMLRMENRLERLEFACEVEKILRTPNALDESFVQCDLFRAYLLEGQPANAERLAEEILAQPLKQPRDWYFLLCEEYCWHLRMQGRPRQALDVIDRQLEVPYENLPDIAARQLLVERARIHAALDRDSDAERDIDDFLKRTPLDCHHAYRIIDAYLLLGFLREQRGDAAGALQAWKDGVAAVRQMKQSGTSSFSDGTVGKTHLVNFLIVASLADELAEDDAKEFIDGMLSRTSVGAVNLSVLGLSALRQKFFPDSRLAEILNEMWRTNLGRQWARRFAYRQVRLDDYANVPQVLAGTQFVCEGAFTGEVSPDDELIAWNAVNDLQSIFLNDPSFSQEIMQLLLLWKLVPQEDGWTKLQKTFESHEHVLPPLGYLFGCRQLKRGEHESAMEFFREALAVAEAGSTVEKLLRQKLGNQ